VSDIPGFVDLPSKANYILFRLRVATGKTGKEVLAFAETKVLILRGRSKKYGSDGWFRVTRKNEGRESFVRDTTSSSSNEEVRHSH